MSKYHHYVIGSTSIMYVLLFFYAETLIGGNVVKFYFRSTSHKPSMEPTFPWFCDYMGCVWEDPKTHTHTHTPTPPPDKCARPASPRISRLRGVSQREGSPIYVLLPQHIENAFADDVKFLCKLFPEDLKDSDALIPEIDLLASDIRVQSKEDDLRLAAKVLCGKWHTYPNLCKAYQIALTVPITVASNERSFSAQQWPKIAWMI